MPQPLINLLLFAVVTVVAVLGWRYGHALQRLMQRNRAFAARVLREDMLKYLMECQLNGVEAERDTLLQLLRIGEQELSGIIADLRDHGMLTEPAERFRLSDTGEEYALRIIRAHRLYERYLADETGYREVEWHRRADEREHDLTEHEIAGLARQLGNPTHDPHGDPIPMQDGSVTYDRNAVPLIELDAAEVVRVIHLEDEPDDAYREIVAAGLASGQVIRVLGRGNGQIRISCEGRETALSERAAANVSVVTWKDEDAPVQAGIPLSTVDPGSHVRVVTLSQRLRGSERRRLLDLGLLPGTRIGVEMRSPGGDPVAYDIRGALIALRKDQAELILVEPVSGPEFDRGNDREFHLENETLA